VRPSPSWNRAQRSWSATEDARPPAGVVAARAPPQPGDRQGPVLVAVVADGEAAGHDVVAGEAAVLEPQRLQDQRGDGPLVGQAGDLLDDPAGQG
jgi:hypothetical protein